MNQNELKSAVAQAAVAAIQPMLTSQTIVGVGTGSTANLFIDQLAALRDQFKGTVASSEESARRLSAHGIEVFDLNHVDRIRVYVDGADEADSGLNLIKGGGAALTREKIVSACSDEFICIADESKWVKTLGAFPLPVEVIPMSREYVKRQLEALGGKAIYREGVVTDNGNHILDVHNLKIAEPKKLEAVINHITGVVTNGLFALKPADLLLLGTQDGILQKRA